jgi:hypothetical protein
LKQVVAASPELAVFLQNPAITATQKKQLTNQLTAAVMLKLGYKAYENQIIATDETGRDGLEVRGFYSTEVGQAFINDRNIASINELVTTAGHEATRAMDHQENVDFDSDRQDRTDYAENYGSLFSAYTDHALDMAGYDAGISQDNNHVGNDSQAVNDNNAVFGGLDKSQGDNFLQHEDKLRYVLLTDALDDCRISGSCSDAQMESMLTVAVRLLKEDNESDQKLRNACRSSSSSPVCRAEVKKLKAAFDTYKNLPNGEQPTKDTWSEYVAVGHLYGTYRSEAYSENARRATETMTREAVSAAGELTLIAVKASAGNEAAQQQLAVIAENIKALVKDPVGTVEQGIKSKLDEADRYEAQGDINMAEEIRSQVFLEGAFAVAGLSTGAVSVIRHGLDLADFKTKADGDSFDTSTQNEVGVDSFVSEDFRPVQGVGADGAFVGLPENYKYVVDVNGDHVVQGPKGGIYQPTELLDQNGNPLYENSGKLYSMEGIKEYGHASDKKFLSLTNLTVDDVSKGIEGNTSVSVIPISDNVKILSERHITNTGQTILGSFPGYISKANSRGASYFDIGNAWEKLTPDQQWAANRNFLDKIATRGDRVNISIPKNQISNTSILSREVEYLVEHKGYKWVNQWSLHPQRGE